MRRILILCNKVPFPPRDGSTIAMASNIRGLLANGVKLTVLALNTKKHHVAQLPTVMANDSNIDWNIVDVDTTPSSFGALKNLLFTGQSYMVSRFEQDAIFTRLNKILSSQEIDAAIIDGLFMMPYADVISEAGIPIYLRAHNVEHKIWERYIAQEKKVLTRKYFTIQKDRLKRFEEGQIKKAKGIMPITKVDAQWFKDQLGENSNIFTYPCGIEPDQYPFYPSKSPDIFHIGAMDWLPNVDGALWFVHEVWSELYKLNNQAVFHLAGRDTEKLELHNPQAGIFVEGRVPSARKFFEQHGIFVVPLRSGSGMRIKVLEAMAYGKAIVTTTIGAEGIPFEDEVDGLIADSPKEFAKAIQRLLTDSSLRLKLGEQAREKILGHFNVEVLAEDLLKFMSS